MSSPLFNSKISSHTNFILVNDTTSSTKNSELNRLEREISKLMQSKKNNNNENNDNSIIETYKEMIKTQHDHITNLLEDVKFLRNDAVKKSNIINNLIKMIQNSYGKKDKDNVSTKQKSKLVCLASNTTDNTPVIAKTPIRNDDPQTNDVRIRNIVNLIEDLMLSPIKHGRKNNSYFEFPRLHEEAERRQHNVARDNNHSESNDKMSSTGIDYSILTKLYQHPLEANTMWKKDTTLIIGDTLLYGIDEQRLHNTKIRVFPGATIEDIYFNVIPLL